MIAFLFAFFTVFNISGITAHCADRQEISFSNIKSIIIENSIDMKIADNNLKNTKQELQKINDKIEDLGYKCSSIKKSISTLESEVEALEDEIKTLKSEISSLPEGDESLASKNAALADKTETLTKKQSDLSKLEAYKTQRTTAQRNSKKAELTYNQTVEQAVYKAQQSYVSCLSNSYQLENKENVLGYNQKKSDIYKLQYESGFLSKKDYENSLRDNTDSENEITELKNKQETLLDNLKLTLGISQGDEITLSNNIQTDLNEVASISYKEDLKEMLKNSTDITIADLELQWAKDDDDEEDEEDDDDYENYSLENKELSLDKLQLTSEINFKEKYNTLMTSYNSLKSSYDKLQQSQQDYIDDSRKYSYGFITKNDLEKTKLDLDGKMSDFNNARNEFYLKYLEYSQMKEGY